MIESIELVIHFYSARKNACLCRPFIVPKKLQIDFM